MDLSSVPVTGRLNVDFSNVDISEVSADVSSTMDGFDVHEFDRYLSPMSGAASVSHLTDVNPPDSFIDSRSACTPETGTSAPLLSPGHDSCRLYEHSNKKQVKTEQMSPGHSKSTSPPMSEARHPPEYTSLGSATSSTSSPSDYTDLQTARPGFSRVFSGCHAGLCQCTAYTASQ